MIDSITLLSQQASLRSSQAEAVAQRLARKGAWRVKTALNAKKRQQRAAKERAKRVDETIDRTFPDRLKALAEKFYQQALAHPAFVLMTPSEIRCSVENRLWSIAQSQPIWFGSGPVTKPTATEAQLSALQKARERKSAIKAEALAPYVPARLQARLWDGPSARCEPGAVKPEGL